MKKLFSHENRMIVFNMKNVLAEEGIETLVMNEFSGGAVGDLSTLDTWPELWLEDESVQQRAQAILQEVMQSRDEDEWYCRGCQEKNPVAFKLCWNCGRAYE